MKTNSTTNKLKFKMKEEIENPNWKVLKILIIATEEMKKCQVWFSASKTLILTSGS